jgi:hypothetical protein
MYVRPISRFVTCRASELVIGFRRDAVSCNDRLTLSVIFRNIPAVQCFIRSLYTVPACCCCCCCVIHLSVHSLPGRCYCFVLASCRLCCPPVCMRFQFLCLLLRLLINILFVCRNPRRPNFLSSTCLLLLRVLDAL